MNTKTEKQVNKNQIAALKATIPTKPSNKQLNNLSINEGFITACNGEVVTRIYDDRFNDVKFAQIDGKLVTSMIGSLSELNVVSDELATLNGYEVAVSKVDDFNFDIFDCSIDDSKLCFRMNPKQYASMLADIKAFMGKHDVRYYLNGFNVIVADGVLTITASNGHTLLTKTVPVENTFGNYNFTVTRTMFDVLSKIKLTGFVNVYVSQFQDGRPNVVEFNFLEEKISVTSALVDRNYPDFNRVFGNAFDTTIRFNTKELTLKLKEISPLVEDNCLIINLNSNELTLSTTSKELCQIKTYFCTQYDKKDVRFGLNLQYLNAALGVCKDEEFILQLSNDESTTLCEQGEHKVVVMTMRV
jgi:DNA polymerase III sliding clamp (beta) subunit (PCNA family)